MIAGSTQRAKKVRRSSPSRGTWPPSIRNEYRSQRRNSASSPMASSSKRFASQSTSYRCSIERLNANAVSEVSDSATSPRDRFVSI